MRFIARDGPWYDNSDNADHWNTGHRSGLFGSSSLHNPSSLVDLATKTRDEHILFLCLHWADFILKCAFIGSPSHFELLFYGGELNYSVAIIQLGPVVLASYDLPCCSDRMGRQSLVASIVSCRWCLSIRYDNIHVIPTRRKKINDLTGVKDSKMSGC